MNHEEICNALIRAGLDKRAEELAGLASPCVRFHTTLAPDGGLPVGSSKVGGRPDLPNDFQWPTWIEIEETSSLNFLCQINLSDLMGFDATKSLPSSGMLYFFYDVEGFTWGFDPKHIGSWRVIYSDVEPSQLKPRDLPEETLEYGNFPECTAHFFEGISMPGTESLVVSQTGLGISDVQLYSGFMDDFLDRLPDGVRHQLGGYPEEIQGDMQLECQLVSNGVYCGGVFEDYDALVREHAPAARDWRLLLQLDTDDNASMMWGDLGRLFFWIREEDLQSRAFDKSWMILQCS